MNRILIGLIAALSLAAASFTTFANERGAAEVNARPDRPAKPVVLVHGAFAEAASWSEVIRILQGRGVTVTAVHLPLSSLAADAATVTRTLDQQSGPTVLVGHSWGGSVITEAGVHTNVASLVYVAAFAPDAGQSINDLLAGLPPAPWLPEIHQDGGGYLTFSQAGIDNYFVPDIPAWSRKVVQATQGPWFAGCLADRQTFAAWRMKPSFWVLPTEDRVIPAPLQEATAAHIGAKVTRVEAGHVPMLSRPHAVAEVILKAALARSR